MVKIGEILRQFTIHVENYVRQRFVQMVIKTSWW